MRLRYCSTIKAVQDDAILIRGNTGSQFKTVNGAQLLN
jgi:hypothetical protein